jgi:hypothetical protein
VALRTARGSRFQMEGATFAKDRSPRLTWRVRGTRSREDEDERRLREF